MPLYGMAWKTMETEDSACVSLQDDVIEIVLAFLSISDLPRAALVCKQWRSFITSSPILRTVSSSLHKRKPWLFVSGPNKKRGMGFDPLARRWICLPPLTQADAVIMEGNGFLFSLAGGRLKLRESFLNARGKWHDTESSMRVWRQNPLVCKDYDGGKIFVIAGVHEFEENPLCVEVFDVNKSEWEMCDPLPHHFKERASSTWLSPTVCNGKIYVLETYTGDFCFYELQRKRWGNVMSVKSWGLFTCESVLKYYCLTSSRGLVLAGLTKEKKGREIMSFRMCIVGEDSKEICMPGEMLSVLINGGQEENKEEEEENNIECRGAGDLVYVFNKSRYASSTRRVCLFDFRTGVWEMLADDHPGLSVNCRDGALFLCSPVTVGETVFTML